MRALFTIHAGEFLVGEYLERTYKNVRVWVPSKDTGVDLLVTDKHHGKALALQVKYSRDFLVSHLPPEFQEPIRACGWWTFDRQKLKRSTADFWVLALLGFAHRTHDFIIIRPSDLLARLTKLYPDDQRIQTHIWTTNEEDCWLTRGLLKAQRKLVAEGRFKDSSRDFGRFLNNWSPIEKLNAAS